MGGLYRPRVTSRRDHGGQTGGEAMPTFDIKVGTVSWIDADDSPIWFSGNAELLEPEWVPKTYIGLIATSNPDPPKNIGDFKAFRNEGNFRACTYCHFTVDIGDSSGKIFDFSVRDAFHDPGWTPPFQMSKFPLTTFSFDWNIYSNEWYQGEASPISVVYTQRRHDNSVISAPAGETVLCNALIKFRAGAHTDDIGINSVGAPFHVPWVWHETLVTYSPVEAKIKLYGRGSIFPSHAWYLQGKRVKRVKEVGDKSFPMKAACLSYPNWAAPYAPRVCMPTNEIAYRQLNLYKVLRVGAPANGPQPDASDDSGRAGEVDSHPYTASGGKLVTATL
jgi:hypothetical protein